jgi:hypothetical protein
LRKKRWIFWLSNKEEVRTEGMCGAHFLFGFCGSRDLYGSLAAAASCKIGQGGKCVGSRSKLLKQVAKRDRPNILAADKAQPAQALLI